MKRRRRTARKRNRQRIAAHARRLKAIAPTVIQLSGGPLKPPEWLTGN